MKKYSILFIAFCFAGNMVSAQSFSDSLVTTFAVNKITPDTSSSGEIPQGVIYVRKSNIIPYVKVEYKYYLSRVTEERVARPVDNGIEGNVEIDKVPVFDSSAYSKKLKRVYPRENLLLSKMFVENMTYLYNASDTPRVDTMVIGMWIDNKGKIRRVLDDPEYTLKMPDQMVTELTRASQKLSGSMWGEKGGYFEKKRRFRQPTLIFESYYCEVFVIVSSYPITQEQKITRYAPFDDPLNSPPLDEQQKASKEKNAVTPKR